MASPKRWRKVTTLPLPTGAFMITSSPSTSAPLRRNRAWSRFSQALAAAPSLRDSPLASQPSRLKIESGVPKAFQRTRVPAARCRCAALGLTWPLRASTLPVAERSPWKLNSRAGGGVLATAGSTPAMVVIMATTRSVTPPRLRSLENLAGIGWPPWSDHALVGRDGGWLGRDAACPDRARRGGVVGAGRSAPDFYAPPC